MRLYGYNGIYAEWDGVMACYQVGNGKIVCEFRFEDRVLLLSEDELNNFLSLSDDNHQEKNDTGAKPVEVPASISAKLRP